MPNINNDNEPNDMAIAAVIGTALDPTTAKTPAILPIMVGITAASQQVPENNN